MQNRSSKFESTKLVMQLSFKNTIKEKQPNGLYFFCNAILYCIIISFHYQGKAVPISFNAPAMFPI